LFVTIFCFFIDCAGIAGVERVIELCTFLAITFRGDPPQCTTVKCASRAINIGSAKCGRLFFCDD